MIDMQQKIPIKQFLIKLLRIRANLVFHQLQLIMVNDDDVLLNDVIVHVLIDDLVEKQLILIK